MAEDGRRGSAWSDLLKALKSNGESYKDVTGVLFGTGSRCGQRVFDPLPPPSVVLGPYEAQRFFTEANWGFNGGFGLEDCVPVHVWTRDYVYFVGCYDGSTWLESIPVRPDFRLLKEPVEFVGG